MIFMTSFRQFGVCQANERTELSDDDGPVPPQVRKGSGSCTELVFCVRRSDVGAHHTNWFRYISLVFISIQVKCVHIETDTLNMKWSFFWCDRRIPECGPGFAFRSVYLGLGGRCHHLHPDGRSLLRGLHRCHPARPHIPRHGELPAQL